MLQAYIVLFSITAVVAYSGILPYQENYGNGKPQNCYPILAFAAGVMTGYYLKSCPSDKSFIHVSTKKNTGECPPGWFKLIDLPNTCFRLTVRELEWEAARIECNKLGGNLAIIKDGIKSDAITEYLTNELPADLVVEHIWIALNDILEEANYLWDPTNKLSEDFFENWGTDLPSDNENLNCVALLYDEGWVWGDVNCETPRLGLCERLPDEKFKCNVH